MRYVIETEYHTHNVYEIICQKELLNLWDESDYEKIKIFNDYINEKKLKCNRKLIFTIYDELFDFVKNESIFYSTIKSINSHEYDDFSIDINFENLNI